MQRSSGDVPYSALRWSVVASPVFLGRLTFPQWRWYVPAELFTKSVLVEETVEQRVFDVEKLPIERVPETPLVGRCGPEQFA